MTVAAQLRLIDYGKKVYQSDHTSTDAAPPGITIGGFPTDMIDIRHAKNVLLTAYGLQSSDNTILTCTIYGVLAAGPSQSSSERMFFSTPMQTGVAFTLGDGVAASGEGYVGSEYAFTDAINIGTPASNGMGVMLDALHSDYNIARQSTADDESPSVMGITGLGPLVGIIVQATTKPANITAFNFLKWSYS